jgi:spermidine/putrescine transport system substrate-binding protein
MKRSRNHSTAPEVSAARRRFLAGSVAATATVSFAKQLGAQTGNGSLRLYSWPDYTGSSTLADFTASSGISVSADFYESSDEMLRTISGADHRYDIIIASYDYIEEMIGKGLLLPLDHSKIPNIANLYPVFNDAVFDPGRRYSMPFLWGTQGICFRRSAVSAIPESWGILLDSDAYSGRIALPGPDTLGLALKYLGYSYNSVDPGELEAAGALLIRQKSHVKAFVGPDGIELLANGDVDLAVSWNTEALRLMEEDDDIDYRVPTEGGLLWQDCVCIPHSSSNPSGAHKLINYALEAEVGAAIAEYLWYATPNRAAVALLPEGYREDHTIFPGMEIIKRCEPALNLGEAGTRLRDQIWQRVSEA